MRSLSRRRFLASSAAGYLSAVALELRANPLGQPIGSQTYPHRQRIRDGDFAGLCKDMAGLGVGILELCSPGYGEFASLTDAKQTRTVIEDHGLKCPSSHFTLNELRTKLDQSIAWAKDIGMTQIGTASLNGRTQNGAATMDVVKAAADEYNKIGEVADKAGIVQFLHDENFEMAKVNGRLVYEVLFELLDPKFVKFQFQMSAMKTVGDPIMYFTKYPGRFISAHLQGVDLTPVSPAPAADAQGGRRGGQSAPQLALGKDSVDWPKVFAAAKTGGVKNYFVEQSWDLTLQSVAYLKTLNV